MRIIREYKTTTSYTTVEYKDKRYLRTILKERDKVSVSWESLVVDGTNVKFLNEEELELAYHTMFAKN